MSLYAVAKILLEDMNLSTEERIQAEKELLKVYPFDKSDEQVEEEIKEVRADINKRLGLINI